MTPGNDSYRSIVGIHSFFIYFKNYNELVDIFKNRVHICKWHASCFDKTCCSENKVSSETEECAVCLTPRESHLLQKTQCNHSFCLSCLDKIIDTSLVVVCPMCRSEL